MHVIMKEVSVIKKSQEFYIIFNLLMNATLTINSKIYELIYNS